MPPPFRVVSPIQLPLTTLKGGGTMTAADLLAALALPPAALCGDVVPKAATLERLKAAADRRLVRERLKRFVFHARLTPLSSALPAAEGVEGLVVAVATTVQPAPALPKLLHRLVPHPMLLLERAADRGGEPLVSLTIRGFRCDLPTDFPDELLAALRPPGAGGDLAALLRRWALAVATADAAALTGGFSWDATRDPAALAADAAEARSLDATIRGLQAKARRERQPGPRATLNAMLREARDLRAALFPGATTLQGGERGI